MVALLDDVMGAGLDGLHGKRGRADPRDDDDRVGDPLFTEGSHHQQAIREGRPVVEHDPRHLVSPEERQSFLHRPHAMHVKARPVERAVDHHGGARIVIDQEQALSHAVSLRTGSEGTRYSTARRNRTRAPWRSRVAPPRATTELGPARRAFHERTEPRGDATAHLALPRERHLEPPSTPRGGG